MKTTISSFALSLILLSATWAADIALTPAQQATLDSQKRSIAKWAAKPVVVAAVKAQNAKGPIAGMDNATWAALKADDPIVVAFQKNKAGLWLAKKSAASKGLIAEAFLCGAKGEKVAFVEKPTSYLHAGSTKFDVPMSGKVWQGPPTFDESSKTETVQLSTPVLDNGKPIGALVVGVDVKKIVAK